MLTVRLGVRCGVELFFIWRECGGEGGRRDREISWREGEVCGWMDGWMVGWLYWKLIY